MDNNFGLNLNDVDVPNHIDDLDEFLNSPWDHNAIEQSDYEALYSMLDQASQLATVAANEAVAVPSASEHYSGLNGNVLEREPIASESPPDTWSETESSSSSQLEQHDSLAENSIPVTVQQCEQLYLFKDSFSELTPIPDDSQPEQNFLTVLVPQNQVNCEIEVNNENAQSLPPIQPIPIKVVEAVVSAVDGNLLCDPRDTLQPALGMTCAEYVSWVKMSPDPPELINAPQTYYHFVQDIQACSDQSPYNIFSQPIDQQPFVPQPVSKQSIVVDQKPVLEFIESPEYVQIPNNYILPSEGTVKAYPVKEIYRVEFPDTKIKKKPRKANINYGTEFFCHFCQKEFGKRGSFQQHWRQKHEDPRPFRCETCGKTYLTERDLHEHQENHDPKKKLWKCNECDNRYRHIKDRDRHFDSHHGTPGHPCGVEGCEKAFARRDHLLAHLVTHNNRHLRELKKAQQKAAKEQDKAAKRLRKRKLERES